MRFGLASRLGIVLALSGMLSAGITALQADAQPLRAFVAQLGFAERRVLLQVGQLAVEQLTGHGQQVTIALLNNAKARQHATLGGAARAQAGSVGTQVVEVAGQLTLQELAGVRAAYGQQAFVAEAAEKGRVGENEVGHY